MDLKQEALAYVNRVRDEYHIGQPLDELPTGERSSGERCPVALAIGDPEIVVWSYATELGADFGDARISHPDAVRSFIKAFDAGEFPELEL